MALILGGVWSLLGAQEQRWELSKSCPDGCGVLNATQSLTLARGSRTKLDDHVQLIPQQ